MPDRNEDLANVLGDLTERLEAANRELIKLGSTYSQATERQRVLGKAEGVRMALSYVNEALKQATHV